MSILGTLTRRHSSVPSTSINACSRVAQDLPLIFGRALGGDTSKRSDRNRQCDTALRHSQPAQPDLEHVFIQSLVAAGHCRHHRAHLSSRSQQGARGWGKKGNESLNTVGNRRGISTIARRQTSAMAKASEEREPLPMPEITKEEYKDIVNTYGLPSDMWDQPAFGLQGRSSKKKGKGQRLAPRLVVTPREEDQPPYAPRRVLEPEDDHHDLQLDRLHDLLRRPRGRVSHTTLWKAYRALRTPRLRYMSDWMIRTLLSHLTWTEYAHDELARKRYFSILEDCLGEQIQLTEKEWTAAIQFAGRAVRNSTDHEVKDAIELWLKMEEAGVKADNVTFNTLFYVAVRAGRFALADTVYSELKARGMELDRYFRISWIYYAGLRGEGDGVRRAFNDMVNAGEIIDSAAMNCVIVSLIRSGEAGAADHVFRKMKALHAEKFGTKGPDDWRGQRQLAKMLNKAGKQLRTEREAHERSFFGTHFSGDDRREQLQEASPINPNARTYRILLRYCCRVSGELDRVKELLAENKERGFHVQGSVYLDIFTAFIIHGGFVHSEWKPSVLEHFWKEFLEASTAPHAGYWLSTGSESIQTLHFDVGKPDEDVDIEQSVGPGGMLSLADEGEDPGHLAVSEEDKTPYFTLSLAKVVIRAFAKCMGTPRMLEVAEEIKARWKDCSDDDLLQLERFVQSKRVDR